MLVLLHPALPFEIRYTFPRKWLTELTVVPLEIQTFVEAIKYGSAVNVCDSVQVVQLAALEFRGVW